MSQTLINPFRTNPESTQTGVYMGSVCNSKLKAYSVGLKANHSGAFLFNSLTTLDNGLSKCQVAFVVFLLLYTWLFS